MDWYSCSASADATSRPACRAALAYVFDEDGDFAQERCNLAGVDLEPVVDERDIELLRNAIDRHLIATDSPRAQWILENWADMCRNSSRSSRTSTSVCSACRALSACRRVQSPVMYSDEKQVKHG